MASPTLPTIHINGTARQTLLDHYNDAYRALLTAHAAFAEIEFNARDYYPQGPDAYPRARTERDIALHKFADLKQYLEAHLVHLAE